jgi:hypothetical protein
MAALKAQPTEQPVEDFLNALPNAQQRADCQALITLFQKITKAPPKLWGRGLVGFGRYHYIYASGREGDSFLVGFAPREANLTLYLMPGLEQYQDLLDQLAAQGAKVGKGCLYIKRLDTIHLPTLKKLVQSTVKHLRATYPEK